MAEPVSRGRGEINEITHIAPIRRGLVPMEERGNSAPITFVDRLKTILEAFHRREDQRFPSVIRMFRGIHTAQWALIDGDSRLMLNVVFDGDWPHYLRSLAFDVPAFLHLIWSNCEGWSDVRGEPDKLFTFIKAYQVRVGFLYAHHPELTVRDVDWLKRLREAVPATGADQGLLDRLREGEKTQTLSEVRSELLRAYDGSLEQTKWSPHGVPLKKLDYAKYAFEQVLRPLYAQSDFRSAYHEAFGEEPMQHGATA